jgi:predicted transglutaminase-like cysteine proteinase
MFGRVAACWVAAFLFAASVAPTGDIAVVANASLAAPSAASPHQQSFDREKAQASPQVEAAAQDAQAPQQMAALDPAEPTIAPPTQPAPPAAVPGVPAAPSAAAPAPTLTEPFGLATMPVANGDILDKWNVVQGRIRGDSDVLARCRLTAESCPPAARRLLAIIAQGRAESGRARIGLINRAINLAIQPESDLAQWGVADRWSAPLETFTTGRGDCEDYAIAKYMVLTEAGVPEADVRLLVVHEPGAGEDHAVVAARLDGAWIILDNRWLRLVDDGEARRMTPLFVLDQTGVRQFAPALAPVASRGAPAAL